MKKCVLFPAVAIACGIVMLIRIVIAIIACIVALVGYFILDQDTFTKILERL